MSRPPDAKKAPHAGARLERDEGESITTVFVLGARETARLQMTGMTLSRLVDPWIRAEARVQLIAADVNGGYIGGARLQRAIRETAGGRPLRRARGRSAVDAKLPAENRSSFSRRD